MMSIFGLALLLLLSPCKVKNYIQSELGVPQTSSLNKSQTAISDSDCQLIDISESANITENLTVSPPFFLSQGTFHVNHTFNLLSKSTEFRIPENGPISLVPLYILFQNLKVYL